MFGLTEARDREAYYTLTHKTPWDRLPPGLRPHKVRELGHVSVPHAFHAPEDPHDRAALVRPRGEKRTWFYFRHVVGYPDEANDRLLLVVPDVSWTDKLGESAEGAFVYTEQS